MLDLKHFNETCKHMKHFNETCKQMANKTTKKISLFFKASEFEKVQK